MPRFPYEPWTVTASGFEPEFLREDESIFALGNGLIGMRGNLDELTADGAKSIQGTYLNGVFDQEPIVYGETAYGYAKNHETICNLMDAKAIRLTADGEALDLGRCNVKGHVRRLDMQNGVLRRSLRWTLASGAVLHVETERLVSLKRQNNCAVWLSVTCVKGTCRVHVESRIAPARLTATDPNDPRTASRQNEETLLTRRMSAEGDLLCMQQETGHSHLLATCAMHHRSNVGGASAAEATGVCWQADAVLAAGETLTLTKSISYVPGQPSEAEATWTQARALAEKAPAFDVLRQEQRDMLDAFWEGAGMDIEGDDALLQGLHFNLFHLLQSCGRDGKRNIAAKGLTGEGYEGHFFWDTEAYILPVFIQTEPTLARKLLEYRYGILPKARERARVMGHPIGALYPWRTIDGEECSAYFPAGTAQYHINGDIAHGIRTYVEATGDTGFLSECGCEMLVEMARVYADLGFYSAEKDGRFVINCVTGPDEYNVLVNNNVYTNRIAAETLRYASETMAWLRNAEPEHYAALAAQLGYTDAEGEAWVRAADSMYYPAPQNGIYPQDDEFLNRKPWPLDSIPAENHPLLLHYHGLNIYRHMVCKQADLILAMLLFGDAYTLREKKENFFFYDSVTTHDSSLSMAVFSMLAAEIGETQKAYDYFMTSARLDLDDIHHNAKDGLHMANMAGTWNGVVKGFGGMRMQGETISFRPVCPKQWQGYRFRVQFRGRTLDVHVTQTSATCRLVSGEPITVRMNGQPVVLS